MKHFLFDKQCAFDTTSDVSFAKKPKLVTLLLVIHFPVFVSSFHRYDFAVMLRVWSNE